MSDLSHLDCRTSLLFYEARRSDFLKDLSDKVELLKAQKRKCEKHLREETFEEHRKARIELNSTQKDAHALIKKFEKSKKDQDNSIKELLRVKKNQVSVNKRSEINYFLNKKKNDIENLKSAKNEEDILIKRFHEFLKALNKSRELWYNKVPNVEEEKSAYTMTLKSFIKEVNKIRQPEQPWYKLKEDEV